MARNPCRLHSCGRGIVVSPPILRLDKTVNEVWQLFCSFVSRSASWAEQLRLFHGTSEEAARAICASHFRLPESATHGSWFGKGIYFADRATKSHAYTVRNKSGFRVIMLCRVVLGKILELPRTDTKAHERVAGTEYSSVLGSADGTNKEFIVFDVAQAGLLLVWQPITQPSMLLSGLSGVRDVL